MRLPQYRNQSIMPTKYQNTDYQIQYFPTLPILSDKINFPFLIQNVFITIEFL